MTGPADDDELLARLAATLRGAQQPPADVDELARASFGLRDLDAQLAELVADSAVDVPAGVRSSPEAPAAPDVRRRRRRGRAAGDAREGRLGRARAGRATGPGPRPGRAGGPGGAVVVSDADQLGRFAIDLPSGGSWRLVCTRGGRTLVVTAWVLLR